MIHEVTRYVVKRGSLDEFVSHRRFNFDQGAHIKWGPFKTARVWARYGDAKRMAQELGGYAKVATVTLRFEEI